MAVELTSKNKAAALFCLHTQTNIAVNFKSCARMSIKDTDVVTLMCHTVIFYASAYPFCRLHNYTIAAINYAGTVLIKNTFNNFIQN